MNVNDMTVALILYLQLKKGKCYTMSTTVTKIRAYTYLEHDGTYLPFIVLIRFVWLLIVAMNHMTLISRKEISIIFILRKGSNFSFEE